MASRAILTAKCDPRHCRRCESVGVASEAGERPGRMEEDGPEGSPTGKPETCSGEESVAGESTELRSNKPGDGKYRDRSPGSRLRGFNGGESRHRWRSNGTIIPKPS